MKENQVQDDLAHGMDCGCGHSISRHDKMGCIECAGQAVHPCRQTPLTIAQSIRDTAVAEAVRRERVQVRTDLLAIIENPAYQIDRTVVENIRKYLDKLPRADDRQDDRD